MSNSTRLWLDDLRPAPTGWVHARSVKAAIEILESQPASIASLDHDFGTHAGDGGDGTRTGGGWPSTECARARAHGHTPSTPLG